MHDAFRVTIVKGFQKLEQVISNLHISHRGDHRSEVSVVKMIENLHKK